MITTKLEAPPTNLLVRLLLGVHIVARHDITLARRPVDPFDSIVREPLQLFKPIPTPQGNTLVVEGGQVRSLGRPLHVQLGPNLAARPLLLSTVLELAALLLAILAHRVVPEYLRVSAVAHDELVAAVEQPAQQALGLIVLAALRRLVDVRHVRVLLEIGEIADTVAVVCVKLLAIALLHGLRGHVRSLVLDEAEAAKSGGGGRGGRCKFEFASWGSRATSSRRASLTHFPPLVPLTRRTSLR